MYQADQDGVYLRVYPSMGRRIIAVFSFYVLGVLLVWVGFSVGGGLLAKGLMVLSGALVLVVGETLRRATLFAVELTTEGLRDTSGTEIVTWDNVDRVERGVFAMKPTNGFSVTLREPVARKWVPGLWWRARKRVGVGGVLPSREARTMGEQMAILLPEHQNGA